MGIARASIHFSKDKRKRKSPAILFNLFYVNCALGNQIVYGKKGFLFLFKVSVTNTEGIIELETIIE